MGLTVEDKVSDLRSSGCEMALLSRVLNPSLPHSALFFSGVVVCVLVMVQQQN